MKSNCYKVFYSYKPTACCSHHIKLDKYVGTVQRQIHMFILSFVFTESLSEQLGYFYITAK